MTSKRFIDWEHSITDKIEMYKDVANFPKAENYGTSDEAVADYVYEKQRILDSGEDRKKNLVVPGIILVMPAIILSGFGDSATLLLLGVLVGVILMMAYFALMGMLDENKMKKMYNPDIERYIAAVEDYSEEVI